MSLTVVDASVAAKWFLPAKGETLMEEAFQLFRRYAKGEIQFLVPHPFWAELANILWKAMRQGRCEKTTAEMALTSLKKRKLPTVSSLSVLDVAFGIAPLSTGLSMTLSMWLSRCIRRRSLLPPMKDWPMPSQRTCP